MNCRSNLILRTDDSQKEAADDRDIAIIGLIIPVTS